MNYYSAGMMGGQYGYGTMQNMYGNNGGVPQYFREKYGVPTTGHIPKHSQLVDYPVIINKEAPKKGLENTWIGKFINNTFFR